MSEKPVAKFRVGNVTAAVWKNASDFFSVTLQRSYKDGEEWKNTDGLGHGDLANAVLVLQRAESFIASR
ncbi:hypothetical protein IVB45_02290 [Bradyrhizobium sp. 4]|uniref:hypothetical protein n=1 Tax=Bradyrhizobium sp. 4 TaxID=2782678 RepID=UPI0020004988|nr:hypothetical protein [Bradyrhizobium sp. 4]UPJ35864.1 hypothetical protein IVB45_02290 [Bradyrhizobium sp. 4]